MKKGISFLVALVFTAGLSACSTVQSHSSPGGPPTVSQVHSPERPSTRCSRFLCAV